MRKLLLLILSILGINSIYAQTFNWAKQFGGDISNVIPKTVLADAYGNTYTSGYFTDSVDFDPGTKTFILKSDGAADIFITKFNPNGNFAWAKKIGGISSDVANSMVLDAQGNILITGSFYDVVDFDPGPGTQTLKSAGDADMFISKLDSAGKFIWVKQFENLYNIGGNGITLDYKQNMFVTGSFRGKTDFDPSTGTAFLTTGAYGDIFVLKLNASGNYIWAKQFVANSAAESRAIAVDAQSNVYTTGRFSNSVDFDPGASNTVFSSGGDWDAFISKLDSSGNFVWAKHLHSNNDETSNSIALDTAANVYTTGNFWGTVDFDLGTDTASLVSEGALDIFVLKLNKSGNYVWAKRMGGRRNDNANSIITNFNGNIYTTGEFEDSADFDPGASRYTLKIGGSNNDVFLSCLNSKGNFIFAKQFKGSNPFTNSTGKGTCIFTNNSGNIITAGYFEGVADFDPNPLKTFNLKSKSKTGMDGFVVKLGQCQSTSFNITDTACNKYVFNGKTYTSSGVYSQQTVNYFGCDSIITLNLFIKKASSRIITDSACKYYRFNGQTYTGSGTYTQTLVNKAKCDSVVTLNLKIKTVNTTVTKNGPTLTAAAIGAGYKWLDCNNSKTPIAGKIAQSFIATKKGSYAVEVTQNACKDTSACIAITDLSANSMVHNGLNIYPNPSNGNLTIDLTTPLQLGTLKLITPNGQSIFENTNISGSCFSINIQNQPAGIYFIEIHQHEMVYRSKVIKN
jgi:hypothetical protein